MGFMRNQYLKIISYLVAAMYFILLYGCAAKPRFEQFGKSLPNLDPSLYIAANGSASEALSSMKNLNQTQLTNKERHFLKKYSKRFSQNFKPAIKTQDPLLHDIILAYQYYWHKGLLEQENQIDGMKSLFLSLSKIAEPLGYKKSNFSESEFEKIHLSLTPAVQLKGYNIKFSGVRPFLNVMIWKNQFNKTYNVNLISRQQKVDVTFMEDFLTLGWAAYATFNIRHVGGWATKEKLFCIKDGYDLNSEEFKVSYLAHEAQHFSDYLKQPSLSNYQLKYRAKLKEIETSNTTYYKIIEKFINEQQNSPKNIHAYASFLLIQSLEKSLDKKFNLKTYKNFDPNIIKETASKILGDNTTI